MLGILWGLWIAFTVWLVWYTVRAIAKAKRERRDGQS